MTDLLQSAAGQPRNLLTVHLWHIIEAVGFLATSLGGIAVAEFLQGRQRRVPALRFDGAAGSSSRPVIDQATDPRAAGRRPFVLPVVALAGVGAASVHVVVMPTHFAESAFYGSFFAVAATMQIVYSAWLLARPSRALLTAGAVSNVSIALLWLYTRTAGIPLGPASGQTEPFGALDTLASFFELVTAIGAFALLRSAVKPAGKPSTWSPAVWVFASLAIAAVTVAAVLAPPS
jgi:hypothetical protein